MYLQAVVGFFQSVFCIVVNRSSPANARETAPPDLNECIEKSPCTPVATALCSRSTAIRLAESGSGPRRCTSPSYRNSKHVHLYECCNCINKLIESTAADVYCGYPSVRLVLLSLPLTRLGRGGRFHEHWQATTSPQLCKRRSGRTLKRLGGTCSWLK